MTVKNKYKVAFMGSADFSVPSLEALLNKQKEGFCEVVAVYCQPEKPAGRGYKQTKCPVHIAAEKYGLPVYTPHSLKAEKEQMFFQSLDLDVAVVAAYGLILPQPILEAPKRGCVNVHASLLPRWRGASPIHQAVLSGDKTSGICLMQMDIGLDTGDVLFQEKTPLASYETTQSLHDKLSMVAQSMIEKYIGHILAGNVRPVPQPDDNVTYAPKITRNEAQIFWEDEEAIAIDRKVRGYYSWPMAWCTNHKGERIKIYQGKPVDLQHNQAPGTVIQSPLVIATKRGAYAIEKLQKEGKKPQKSENFVKGSHIKVDALF